MLFSSTSLLSALQLSGIVEYAQSLTGSSRGVKGSLNKILGDYTHAEFQRDAFLDTLVANMSVPELGEFLFRILFNAVAYITFRFGC